MRALLLPVLALAMGLRALPAAAACGPLTSAANVCTSMVGNTCVIASKQCTVAPGTILDFGTHDVRLQQGASLDVGTGLMTIKANGLTLQPGTALLGHGGSIAVQTSGPIAVLAPSGTGAPARIDVSDPVGADRIELTSSGGTVEVDGILDAQGTNTDGTGGEVDLTGVSVLVSGQLQTSGGNLGVGGAISAEATDGSVTISGTLLGDGGNGGIVELTADTDGTLTILGTIDIRANAAGGDGGMMTLNTKTGSMTIGGKIFMQGDEGTDTDGGANGGELDVFSGGGVTLSAALEISGKDPDGQGGDVFILSELDTVQTGTLLAQGRGAESDGGSVEFESHKALTLRAIDTHGGESLPDSGGSIQATAWCDLTVPSGVVISAEGDKGDIHLLAGGQIVASGSLRGGAPIVLEYLSSPPITTGGTFTPSLAPLVQNAGLTPCGGFPPAGCGDGVRVDPEQCDDGNTQSCDGCSSTCRLEVCGNGVVDCGEACDDGNTVSGDGCHGDCSRIERCGDGIVDSPETCDDGNTTSCDGCSSTCQVETCGNGIVDCGEECEPPGVGGCSADCTRFVPPGCGDHVVTPPEECDDGNTVDGDGCSHQCRIERCGNGTIDPGEQCDDFNTNACDGCSPTCKLEVCGNGILDCGEECDDGAANGAPGGSCLPDVCKPGPICSTGGVDPCIPCATTLDCDPLNACGSSACQSGVCTPVTPPSCDDGNVCNGAETCAPATGCKAGTPLVCDDGDACTTDSCDPVSGCAATPLAGFAMPECRIKAARDVVTGAAAADIATATRTKLLKKLGGVEAKILAADQARGNAKKVRKAINVAMRQLHAATNFVGKQSGKKIATATANAILDALGVLPDLLHALTP